MGLRFSFGWVCFLLSLLVLATEAHRQIKIFNVEKYGASADGVTDNSEPSRVQISNVTYKNIWGISASKVAVSLHCSQSRPCSDVMLENINLPYNGREGDATAFCSNVKGLTLGQQNPPSCI
ncbi:exopolygalacturonase-like [Fagus crenata]